VAEAHSAQGLSGTSVFSQNDAPVGASQRETDRQEPPEATLGDVLYANQSTPVVVEGDWVALVQAIAAGDQLALHALYERSHRLVFTLIMRITRNHETAEEVTVDVFHEVWKRAAAYEAANGSVLGWIMNQARSRAIDRLRFEQRKKRIDPHEAVHDDEVAADSRDIAVSKQEHASLRKALGSLTEAERLVIEAAFFAELTHVEVAARLDEPLGTVKTRIRSGLHKLRQVLAAEVKP
jgi:RNA polymerase sigma-70 factor, ECF subfamily